MLLVSFLLVIVATIFLLSGLFLTKDLPLIFISIGCSALAGVVLILAVLRSRPRPAVAPGVEGTVAADTPIGSSAAAPAVRKEQVPSEGRSFPIDDYDALEVVEVLPRLGDLTPAELAMVRQREAAGRAHPWVLARIDALLEAEAPTGEVEWAPSGRDEERDVDMVEPGWDEAEPEWAPTGRRDSEWSAADFELEASGEFDDIDVVREFPISRYHDLRANEILPLLGNLDSEDLKMVREEEAAGKARTSILSRIDVLLARDLPTTSPTIGRAARPAPSRASAKPAPAAGPAPAAKVPRPSRASASLPIENYDNLTVPQITAHLRGLTLNELKAVRTYERRHKARLGVLQKIDGAILRAGGR